MLSLISSFKLGFLTAYRPPIEGSIDYENDVDEISKSCDDYERKVFRRNLHHTNGSRRTATPSAFCDIFNEIWLIVKLSHSLHCMYRLLIEGNIDCEKDAGDVSQSYSDEETRVFWRNLQAVNELLFLLFEYYDCEKLQRKILDALPNLLKVRPICYSKNGEHFSRHIYKS